MWTKAYLIIVFFCSIFILFKNHSKPIGQEINSS